MNQQVDDSKEKATTEAGEETTRDGVIKHYMGNIIRPFLFVPVAPVLAGLHIVGSRFLPGRHG